MSKIVATKTQIIIFFYIRKNTNLYSKNNKKPITIWHVK